MAEVNDVHRQIEDEFVKNLQRKGIGPAVSEELVCVLSENKKPKASDLIDFYTRHSNGGDAK